MLIIKTAPPYQFTYSAIAILLLCFFTGKAQEPLLKNYSVKDGLPSSEVYSAFQDKKGFMWFCTDAGVSRFDGYSFKNYTTYDGLSDNTVFRAFEDSKGRIWFSSLSGKLSYFFNDSIYQIKANKKLQLNSGSLMTSLYVDEGDTVWCGIKNKNQFYKIAPGYQESDIINKSTPEYGYHVLIKKNTLIWGSTANKDNFYDSVYIDSKVVPIVQINKANRSYKTPAYMIYCKNKRLLLAHRNIIFNYTDGAFKECFKITGTVSITEDRNGDIWIGKINKGVYVFKNGDFSRTPLHYLDGYSVSYAFVDNEGGTWLTTIDKGIFYMPSNIILNYTTKSGLTKEKIINITKVDSEKIIMSSERDEFFMLETRNSVVRPLIHNKFSNAFIKEEIYIALKGYVNSAFFYATKAKKITTLSTYPNPVRLLFYKNEKVYLTFLTSFGSFKNLYGNHKFEYIPLKLRVNSIYVDNENTEWFATTSGLWSYENNRLNNWGIKYPLLSKRIEDIKVSNDNTWWLASKGEGVIIKKDDSVIQLTQHDGLPSNICRSVFIDTNNIIWISTNSGISKIIWKGWNKYTIENFTTSDGLISDEVNQIIRCRDNLYVATNSGVSQFNPAKLLKNLTPPPIHISKFFVNPKPFKVKDSIYQFNYSQNFITINFIGISYHKIGKLFYKYRLKGLDSTWHTTANTSIQYTSLGPANYSFEIFAVTDDGIQSTKPGVLTFYIDKPFWLKWWFITLAAFIILVIIVVIYNFRIATIKKNESEKTLINKQIADIELKALRAQMNPHFIFNSINSIQHFILENDRLSAQKYLAKFARLIRNVMENSKHEYVLLNQELQTLKLYIELEILRSSFSFSYELTVDENINGDTILIPPMVLQPYVENAILHGIIPLEHKNGCVNIKIEKEDDYLKCTINDNGIGRKLAMDYKAKKRVFHQSMGLSITKERLDILNHSKANKLTIQIVDKFDEQGAPQGTSVVLFMPVIYKKNIHY